jgi:hypothetical protein
MGQPGTATRGRTRMARLGLCSAILAILVGGCGGSARDATAEAKPSVPLYSEGAAAAVADALLAAVPLPSDTQHVSEPPQAVAGKLGRSRNSEDSAKAVDRYAYWSSTATAGPRARPKAGLRPSKCHWLAPRRPPGTVRLDCAGRLWTLRGARTPRFSAACLEVPRIVEQLRRSRRCIRARSYQFGSSHGAGWLSSSSGRWPSAKATTK